MTGTVTPKWTSILSRKEYTTSFSGKSPGNVQPRSQGKALGTRLRSINTATTEPGRVPVVLKSVKFKIYTINTQARKEYLLNYKACMGTLLQRMYGHILVYFSAMRNLIHLIKLKFN